MLLVVYTHTLACNACNGGHGTWTSNGGHETWEAMGFGHVMEAMRHGHVTDMGREHVVEVCA